MKAFTLIFVVAVITDCLGAQSDRSRQRSGPIRSVPVAADIKRDVNFDCPEEFGYYPHPTDCSLYYVCVFGGALLESCTGGLMYSHELQTCDWPRNVGCDATGAVAGEELERLSERAPQSVTFAPRRHTNPPPPPPRVQPNPVVTSRGQPKFSRDEYEKQQQLYADVDDLPPVEELENDRQQRVYRGQPSTIGEVQKQRDGYVSQSAQPARNFNSNIIPASIPQNNHKIGSFSFGSQVDERRTATATPAPQRYSLHNDIMTDPLHDKLSDITKNKSSHSIIVTNEIAISRKKREIEDTKQVKELNFISSNSTEPSVLSKRSDSGDGSDFFETDSEYFSEDDNNEDDDDDQQDDIERGKRQTQHYYKNAYKQEKRWSQSKPNRFVESSQFYYNPQNQRQQQQHLNSLNSKHFFDDSTLNKDSYYFPTSNPFASYQIDSLQLQQRPFKPSLPDHYNLKQAHNPMNSATQIITKSPPISSLRDNPFASLAGGFYNNNIKQSNSQNNIQYQLSSIPSNQYNYQDSSHLSSAIVTGKPILLSHQTSNRPSFNKGHNNQNEHSQNSYQTIRNHQHTQKEVDGPYDKGHDYEEANSSEEDDSFDNNSPVREYEDEEESNKPTFPKPLFEYRHPKDKYVNIKNPDFDFDKFLEKLRDDHYTDERIATSTSKPVNKIVQSFNNARNVSNDNPGLKSSTLKYFQGMSTPRPFSIPLETGENLLLQQIQESITAHQEKYNSDKNSWDQQMSQQRPPKENNNEFKFPQQSAGTPLETLRPKLKPPNFKDDRQLPISYSFSKPIDSLSKPDNVQTKVKESPHKFYSVTQEPFFFVKSTPQTLILSTPNHKYVLKPQNIPAFQSQSVTGKPYLVSSIKPIITLKHSTPKPITTLTNEQISAFRQFWNNNPSTESGNYIKQSKARPSMIPDIPNLESLFSQAIRSSTQSPVKNLNIYLTKTRQLINTTTQAPKRRPIPKPSPEMNDYYYDEDEYYEPPVKSQYMPSTEVKPQRPLMAQNDQEYEDSYEDSQDEKPISSRPQQPVTRKPVKQRPDTVTKNHNDVSAVTKAPTKNKNINGKIPVPVMVGFSTPSPMVHTRPGVSNYKINHHVSRNRTVHIRKPGNGPNTVRPPKFLNQTTLRPYTVRHRLAKPTTVKDSNNQDEEMKIVRGLVRHQNIVTSMKFTTPRYNSETRYTKSKLNNKLNSLEPTESVAPVSFSPSPRPKMLYNGSQSYNPDHYDPYYAVYDEDGELYKDNDYVQQYNSASLRPAVQQTYRGTPPPARRPEYTPRPSLDDYDDALIQGQIHNNQNQYQAPIRQSTRGEGNELGYDHNPSSVRTTVYEATTPISTTSSTTSTTTTTTQRPTSAPLTEAMTPTRITLRSSTDEIPNQDSEPSLNSNSTDEPTYLYPSTLSPSINISSLAKPFEKTDNLHRLKETLPLDDADVGDRNFYHTTYKNLGVDVFHPEAKDNKKVVSLTSGFSIRRNPNNTHNPYTLTVLTRPYEKYHKTDKTNNLSKTIITTFNDAREESIERAEKNSNRNLQRHLDTSMRRSDASSEIVTEEDDIPIYVPPTLRMKTVRSKSNAETTPPTTKYYLKTVIKRPAPFSSNDENYEESTENAINTDALIETALQNVKLNSQSSSSTTNPRYLNKPTENSWKEPAVSPYRTLNNLRKPQETKNYKLFKDYTSTTSSTTTLQKSTSPVTPREVRFHNLYAQGKPNKPSYFSYHVTDDDIPDTTTEVFSGRVKNVLKAFFNNFVTNNPKQKISDGYSSTSPTFFSSPEEKTVNIGFQKKKVNYDNVKPLQNNVKRVQILSNPSVDTYSRPINKDDEYSNDNINYITSSTPPTSSAAIISADSQPSVNSPTFQISTTRETFSNNEQQNIFNKESLNSKFNFATTRATDSTAKSTTESPSKFQKIIETNDEDIENNENNELTKFSANTEEQTKKLTNNDWSKPNNRFVNEIASTTSTTKMTMTAKADPTSSTKSLSFPTRATRVNAAIKQAATNPGGGRRSYQSSSKCSSDNSLQANPKCNEIKYQRPSGTRGRGSAHYSTLSESAAPQQNLNRGTPPTRSRPTLKPSTSIVSKSTEFVDIYNYPAGRPAPVYPQPTPDKTAAKCRKDVCLLPDCYCGGKDIPGDMPVESVPQIVLLTFDDSVNDLNKGLYTDLFEKGRVNPNGCPISATFYVSHEWTDYSQVQNLYSAGHEMASHTISHSFGEQFSQKKWNREVAGQREILAAYGGVKLEDVRGMRAPFLSVGGNKMFKMLYDSNFTYDSSMPVYENRPPSWPYTLDYKLFHDCMIPPCPTKSYPGVWEVPMVMWQDLNGGRCSMGDACANPPEAENVYKMLFKNFDRHYTTNRAPFGLFYHAAWFTQPHHKEGFIMFLDAINQMQDVWIVTNWQALQWVRDPTPISRINNFQPFQCNYQDRPKKCNNPKVCNLWHKSGVRYMRTCQPCPEIYPWTGKTGIRSSRIDNDIEE